MNKGQLINAVSNSTTFKPKEAASLVEIFTNIIAETLLTGEEVTIPGVGKLKVNTRPGRNGRNPATGAAIIIPEKRVVKFSPSAEFETRLTAK